jgi:hypothetical protein
MKLHRALALSMILVFGFSVAAPAWVPAYAAQPHAKKKGKTAVTPIGRRTGRRHS